MGCVGYDNAFQLEICEKFPLWASPPKRTRGSGKSSPKKSKMAGRKRKREETPDSENDEREEATGEFNNLSEDEDEVLTYRPRGVGGSSWACQCWSSRRSGGSWSFILDSRLGCRRRSSSFRSILFYPA